MAQPITRTFKVEQQELFQKISSVIDQSDFTLLGSHQRLGLLSFYEDPQQIIYVHLAPQKDEGIDVSIAPGVPMLGEQKQSVVPKIIINGLFDDISDAI